MWCDMVFWRRCYLAVLILLHVLHPMLSPSGRSLVYLLCGALAVPPLVALVRRAPCPPWWLLLGAMVLLSVGNSFNAFGGPRVLPVVQILVTLGHATLLGAAIALVLRRGRNDIGGMLDVAVAAVALGGLVWTALLFPQLVAMHSDQSAQLTILIGILALAGVLGALLRLWFAGGRQPALGLLLLALTSALGGNIVLARTSGQMTTTGTHTVDMGFMLAYGLVGLAALHPSAAVLIRPSDAPADRLTTRRLLFLGLALLANPVAGGVRQMLGLGADGPLLAAGSLLVTALVLIRVGRLARQHERAERRLRHQATHDLLTGLPNRAELLTRLAAALDRERATGRPAVVLLFCDLNGFKQVNDRLGHEVGDQLLTGVADRIGAGLRAGETLARYGGDEFLLLCEDDAAQSAAIRLAGHVERALAEPFRLAGELVPIGSSVGAVISGGDESADELISRADQAMYRAKQAHRAARTAPGLLQPAGNADRGTP